ncbi:hypothetical protein diail_1243 [Diaporthe ilicicola]|nr:hypothetical protein diail_1243 [Diaporthe ilicicola]
MSPPSSGDDYNAQHMPDGQTAADAMTMAMLADGNDGRSDGQHVARQHAAPTTTNPPSPANENYNDSIMAASATLAYIQNICLDEKPPPKESNDVGSRTVKALTRASKMLRRFPGETVAVSAFITTDTVELTIAQDNKTWEHAQMGTDIEEGQEPVPICYKCPELFDEILLHAIDEYAGKESRRDPSAMRRHLIRLQAIIAGDWKMSQDAEKAAQSEKIVIRQKVLQYLAASSFPLLWHEAKIAFAPARDV